MKHETQHFHITCTIVPFCSHMSTPPLRSLHSISNPHQLHTSLSSLAISSHPPLQPQTYPGSTQNQRPKELRKCPQPNPRPRSAPPPQPSRPACKTRKRGTKIPTLYLRIARASLLADMMRMYPYVLSVFVLHSQCHYPLPHSPPFIVRQRTCDGLSIPKTK